MASLKVVEDQVVIEGPSSPVRAAEGSRVGPFSEQGPDHAFGLAVGLGTVGASKALTDPEFKTRGGEGLREVRAAVVRQEPLDRNAVAGEPGDGPHEERRGRFAQFVGQHLGLRQARVIVDGNVQELPPDTGDPRAAITVNSVADPPDLPQHFYVQMHQLTGPRPFIPHDLSWGLEGGQRVQPLPAQFGRDSRQRNVIVLRDARAAPALLAGFADLTSLRAPQSRR